MDCKKGGVRPCPGRSNVPLLRSSALAKGIHGQNVKGFGGFQQDE